MAVFKGWAGSGASTSFRECLETGRKFMAGSGAFRTSNGAIELAAIGPNAVRPASNRRNTLPFVRLTRRFVKVLAFAARVGFEPRDDLSFSDGS